MERQGVQGTHLLEPQKAHATGDFIFVEKDGGHTLLCLAFSPVTVVRQADSLADENLSFGDCFLSSLSHCHLVCFFIML